MVIPVFDTGEPPDLGNGRIRSKEETHPRSRIRPDRVNAAKWVDEPEQNYTDGMVGDWSQLPIKFRQHLHDSLTMSIEFTGTNDDWRLVRTDSNDFSYGIAAQGEKA